MPMRISKKKIIFKRKTTKKTKKSKAAYRAKKAFTQIPAKVVTATGKQYVTRSAVKQIKSDDYNAVSISTYAKKPSAYKLAMSILEPQWFRIQGMTRVEDQYGFFPVANRITVSNQIQLPMHVWDITSCINNRAGVEVNPNQGYHLGFDSDSASATAITTPLLSQDSNGATISVGNTSRWQVENTSSGTSSTYQLNSRKALHAWTQIKMNLYGVRTRNVRWVVQLVKVKDEFADFISAGSSNREKQKLFDYLARPFIYNNLLTGDPQVAADVKVLKTYETVIGPMRTDESTVLNPEGGLNNNPAPHIQTVNMFINHNAIRRYDWRRDVPPIHDNAPRFDVETSTDQSANCQPKDRIYLLIRALAPQRRTLAGNDWNTIADVSFEPSYDLVLRNKFLNPS
nr:putative capsid protein [Cressdnaviricota sp.]UOF81648.1 putative capsid protein [Cressdnaviricota sp.]